MTSRKELKSIARESLEGRWGISIGLIIMLIAIFVLILAIPFIGWLAVLIAYPAIIYIFPQIFFNIKRHENISVTEILSRLFKSLKTYWGIALRTLQKLIPFVLVYALGIILVKLSETKESLLLENVAIIISFLGYILLFIQSLYYTQAIYIITDNPSMSYKDAVLKSKELMTGHRFEYFILKISFFGWAALSYLTCGLGDLYVKPYMYTTFAAYYDALIGYNNGCEEIDNNEVIIE